MSVQQGAKGAVLKCHAGGTTSTVVKALGLTMADLFDGTQPSSKGSSSGAKPKRVAEYI